MIGLPGPEWIKIGDDLFEHPKLKNWRGTLCQYTFMEAKTIQNGWDSSKHMTRCPDCGEVVNNFFDHITGCFESN